MTILNFIRKNLGMKMKYEVHFFVEKYCKGKGIEIGGAEYNSFDINVKNVDFCRHDSPSDVYYKEQIKRCNKVKKVDIVAYGDDIPIADSSVDFVFSSHVIEHFWNPVSAIREWHRVTRNGGYIVMLIPNKLYTFDCDRECTTIEEFRKRDENYDKNKIYEDMHHSVWTLESFLDFAQNFNFNVIDYIDKPKGMENSFGIVIKVIKN